MIDNAAAERPRFAVEPAAEADLPRLAQVWREGWHEAHDGRVPEALVLARTDASFTERAPELTRRALVARELGSAEGAVVGFVATRGEELDQLYVASSHRGVGVATRLLAAAEDRLAAAGHTRAWLAVVPDNLAARRFYERNGWVDSGSLDHLAPGPTGPIRVPARRYTKELGSRRSGRAEA